MITNTKNKNLTAQRALARLPVGASSQQRNATLHQAAIRSQRSRMGHITRRENEVNAYGRVLTTWERAYIKATRTYFDAAVRPRCEVEGKCPAKVQLAAAQVVREAASK